MILVKENQTTAVVNEAETNSYDGKYVGMVGALKIIEESYVNDMAIFEALFESDLKEASFNMISEAEGQDAETKENAKKNAKDTKEKTKFNLIQTIQALIEKIRDKFCALVDATMEKIFSIKKDHMDNYVEQNRVAVVKKDFNGFDKKIEVTTSAMDDANFIYQHNMNITLADIKNIHDSIINSGKDIKEDAVDKAINVKIQAEDPKTVTWTASNIQDVIDFITAKSDIRIKATVSGKSQFKQAMNKLKAECKALENKNSEDPVDAVVIKNYITIVNCYQRIIVKAAGEAMSAYNKDLRACFGLFKAAVNYKTANATATESTIDVGFEGLRLI